MLVHVVFFCFSGSKKFSKTHDSISAFRKQIRSGSRPKVSSAPSKTLRYISPPPLSPLQSSPLLSFLFSRTPPTPPHPPLTPMLSLPLLPFLGIPPHSPLLPLSPHLPSYSLATPLFIYPPLPLFPLLSSPLFFAFISSLTLNTYFYLVNRFSQFLWCNYYSCRIH